MFGSSHQTIQWTVRSKAGMALQSSRAIGTDGTLAKLGDDEQLGHAYGTSRTVQGRSGPQGSEVRVGTKPVPQGDIRRLRMSFIGPVVL